MYILGVDVPENKYVWLALTRIYGVGQTTGRSICDQLSISRKLKLRDLPETKIMEITQLLNGMKIESELRREVNNNIRNLVQCNSYRGLRHLAKLPVRGQRTHTRGKIAKRLNGKGLSDLRKYHTYIENRTTSQAITIPSPTLFQMTNNNRSFSSTNTKNLITVATSNGFNMVRNAINFVKRRFF